MKIKDLKKYPKLYNRALECQREQGKEANDNINLLDDFLWSKTNEGSDFWGCVYDSDFEIAKELEPHLFEVEETKQPKKFIRVESNTKDWSMDFDYNLYYVSNDKDTLIIQENPCGGDQVFVGSINNFYAYVVESK